MKMANIIKIKRGYKADVANLTLLPGELGVTLDTHELYVGDQNGVKQLVKGEAAGSVESAGKLTTARNIAMTGAATGSASFDGSKDIEIALALATSGVKAGTYNNVTVNDKGLVTGASNVTYTIEDITGLKDTLGNMYTKSEVNELIANAEVDAYTKSETDSIVSGLEASIAGKAAKDNVYTKTEINTTVEGLNTAINKKANSADVYTKEEVNTELNKKANQSTTYTKSEVDELLSDKANSATTLMGYGITDAYTADTIDSLLNAKADATTVNGALATKADVSTVSTLETNLTKSINTKATAATTLAGYGIEDTYTKTEVDGMVAGTFHFRGSKASLDELNALTGMKEGDVYQVADKEYAYNGQGWVELGFNIDLSAYATTAGVAEAYATKQSLTDGLATKADTSNVYTKNEIDGKVTTINNSIDTKANSADVYTKGQVDTALAGKAATATTLAGYGITDAYTKTQADSLLDNKADAATTLAGYQISDAYTKTEIDTEIERIDGAIGYKLDANSMIDGGTFGEGVE
jgi:hypothetical protein